MSHNPLSEQLLRQLFDVPKTGQKCRDLMRFSPSEMTLLAALAYRRYDREPTITMSEISELLDVSKPAATQLVLRLCLKGYLERFHDEHDRRVIRVQLAPQVSHFVEEHIERMLDRADRVIETLGEEKSRQFLALQREFSAVMFGQNDGAPSEDAEPHLPYSIRHKEAIV